jgi:hypothetical protein
MEGLLADGADRLLEVAVAAHLSRYHGKSRVHTESDLEQLALAPGARAL